LALGEVDHMHMTHEEHQREGIVFQPGCPECLVARPQVATGMVKAPPKVTRKRARTWIRNHGKKGWK
jgi:hypothetical protein